MVSSNVSNEVDNYLKRSKELVSPGLAQMQAMEGLNDAALAAADGPPPVPIFPIPRSPDKADNNT